jgi:DNA repair protein RecN (Recombination protein N)
MGNTDRILNVLYEIKEFLSGDNCAVPQLSNYCAVLENLPDMNGLAAIQKRLSAAGIELADIASEISSVTESLVFEPEIFEYIKSRRDEFNSLKLKYNTDCNGLIDLYREAENGLNQMDSGNTEMRQLAKQREELLEHVTVKARELSELRAQTAAGFTKQIAAELEFLDMPGVKLEISHVKGKLTVNGMDSMEILISANKGEVPKPIHKIASGGELSRIMLALKSIIADSVPTMVFDEIDAGVSGRAAQKIGTKLRSLAMPQTENANQVICVTHLAQIAVKANNHFLIEKNTVGDRIVTEIKPLDADGRVNEIARIMEGENPGELTKQTARELITAANAK